MPNDEHTSLTVRQLIEVLPWMLRGRFLSFISWVEGEIEEQLLDTAMDHRPGQISGHDRELITLVIFVKALRRTLQYGSEVAKSTLATFESLGAKGVRIGNTRLIGNSDAVVLGGRLSWTLLESLQGTGLDSYLKIIEQEQSVKEEVRALLEVLRDE